jgi:uncharacterized protein (DUF58 family)
MLEFFENIRKINLKIKFLSTDIFAGEYVSAFKGRGLEFEEVREYIIGDDIKSIDWNTSARTGNLYTKVFKEERELTVVIIVDISGSMHFGSKWAFKSSLSTEIAALLAYTALRSNDKVSLILFDENVRTFIPPRKGKNHIWHIIKTIIKREEYSNRTNIDNSLKFLANTIKKKSAVFIISDFLTDNFSFFKTMKILKKRFDFVPFIITDPYELKLSDNRIFNIKDLESGNFYQTVPEVRFEFLNNLNEKFKEINIKPLIVSTDKPYFNEIVKYFRERRGIS